MKPVDLMIGDYIMFNKNTYIIEEISKKGWAHLIENDGSECHVELSSDYILDAITPIPLTAEILKKNGFVSPTIDDPEFKNYVFKDTFIHKEQLPNVELMRVNYYDGVEWDFYALLGERKSSDCGEQYEYMATIKYVHELQHILKLCGIEKEIIV